MALIGERIAKAPPQDGAADLAQATRYFVISEDRQALARNLLAAEKRCQGNFVALLGQVKVCVTGPCVAGNVLVPSGAGDGCARAFAPDAVPPGCLSLGCVLRTGDDGCVWAFVHPDSGTAPGTTRRIGKLEARFHGCEERLEPRIDKLLRMQADATPQGAAGAEPPAASAAALARGAWTGRLARGYAYSLPEEVAGSLGRRGSLAGALLVLSGWAAELDDFEAGIATTGAQEFDAAELGLCTQQQLDIFARLVEANEGYQRKL